MMSVKVVKAEQKAELAEFDENIPWDEREAELRKRAEVSKVEMELAKLDKEVHVCGNCSLNICYFL